METATVLLPSFENTDFLTWGFGSLKVDSQRHKIQRGSIQHPVSKKETSSGTWKDVILNLILQDEEDGHHPAPYTRCCDLGQCFEKFQGRMGENFIPSDIGGWGGDIDFWKQIYHDERVRIHVHLIILELGAPSTSLLKKWSTSRKSSHYAKKNENINKSW